MRPSDVAWISLEPAELHTRVQMLDSILSQAETPGSGAIKFLITLASVLPSGALLHMVVTICTPGSGASYFLFKNILGKASCGNYPDISRGENPGDGFLLSVKNPH